MCKRRLAYILLFIIKEFVIRFIIWDGYVRYTFWFHNTVTIPSLVVSTNYCTWSHQRYLYNFKTFSFHMLNFSQNTLYSFPLSTLFPSIEQADMCSTLLLNSCLSQALFFVSVCSIFVAWCFIYRFNFSCGIEVS